MEVVAAGTPVVVGLSVAMPDSRSGPILVTEVPTVVGLAGSVELVVGAVVGGLRSGMTTVVNMLVVVGTAGSEEAV